MSKRFISAVLCVGAVLSALSLPVLAAGQTQQSAESAVIAAAPDQTIMEDSLFYAADHSVYFADVTTKYFWAVTEVDYLANTKTVSGTGNCLFTPDASIRRADFLLMLYRAYNMSAYKNDNNFADVPAGAYYADALSACKMLGIATADSAGNFRPTEPLTREDAMVFLKRTLDLTGLRLSSGSLASFTDADKVAPYAADSVGALVKAGVISGADGKLSPKSEVSRASMSVMLYRALMLENIGGQYTYNSSANRTNVCIGSSFYPNVTLVGAQASSCSGKLFHLISLTRTDNGYVLTAGPQASFSDTTKYDNGRLTVNGNPAVMEENCEIIAVDLYGKMDYPVSTGSGYSKAAVVYNDDGAVQTIYYQK